jgi:D-alanyl-lipoteichoic acid acyltransferase DltB (MBOAT superfamily)
MPQTTNIIGWIITLIISCVGWYLVSQNNKNIARDVKTKAAEVARAELSKVDDIVNRLPCVKNNGDYMKAMGKQEERIDRMEKDIHMILEEVLNKKEK